MFGLQIAVSSRIIGKLTLTYQVIEDFNDAPIGTYFFDSTQDIPNSPSGVRNGFLFHYELRVSTFQCGYQIILGGNNVAHKRVLWYSRWSDWKSET